MSLLHRILYSFTAEEEGELSVKAGDLVVLKSELLGPFAITAYSLILSCFSSNNTLLLPCPSLSPF